MRSAGSSAARVHDRRAKKVRDLEVSGRRTVLVWSRRRMVCSNCACRFLEDHPAFEGALTARLSRRVVADAKVMTFSAVVRRHGVHCHAVRALVDTWSALVAERRRSRRCAVLLVDETSMRKRHRYVTVIVNGDTGRTLAIIEHRSSAALSAFLMQQGHRWCKGVKVVVSDGSKAYKAAIDAHLGHARHVLDRFHVIRWFAAGLTQVRRDVQRRPEGSKPAFDPEVFRARFALLRRGDTLTDADRVRLDALFDAHPRLRAGLAGTPGAPRPLPRRRLRRRPSTPWGGSATYMRPASCPSTTTQSTPSSPGQTRSSPGTTATGPPTAESREPFSGACQRVSSMSLTGTWRAVGDAFSGACRWRPRCCWRRELDSASFGLPPPVEMRWRWPVRVQRVVMPVTGAESWTVVDDGWAPVEPVERYLAHLAGIERSPNTVRAYAHGLRLWFEFLGARRLAWDSRRDRGRLAVRGMAAGSGRQRDRVR